MFFVFKGTALLKTMGGKEWWEPLAVLLDSNENFAERLKAVSNNLDQIKAIAFNEGFIIICGAGIRGQNLARILKREETYGRKTDILYADNDSRIWDSYIDGIRVLSVDQCAKEYPDAVFVIANKAHYMQIRDQLAAKGISKEKIFEYKPTAEWSL